MNVSIEPVTGSPLIKVTLTNSYLSASFYNFGARMHQLFTPNKEGLSENILLSYDSVEELLSDNSYFGAVVGPVAGRIKHAQWKDFPLEKNCGTHHIHGGSQGWSYQFWTIEPLEDPDVIGIRFHLEDSVSGYPGPINVRVTYKLVDHSLIMTTDYQSMNPTIVNPTSHSYFNLSGEGQQDLDTHSLLVNASHLLETDEETLPTGKIIPVKELPLDVSKMQSFPTIFSSFKEGLDDCFILNKTLPTALTLTEQTSGRKMEIATTNQSVVLFSTTGFDAPFLINGKPMHSNYGLAIEPQQFPDSVHHPSWPSIELPPLQKRQQETIYRFSCL